MMGDAAPLVTELSERGVLNSFATHQHTISVLKSISMSLFPLTFSTVSPFSFWGVCRCWYILRLHCGHMAVLHRAQGGTKPLTQSQ